MKARATKLFLAQDKATETEMLRVLGFFIPQPFFLLLGARAEVANEARFFLLTCPYPLNIRYASLFCSGYPEQNKDNGFCSLLTKTVILILLTIS